MTDWDGIAGQDRGTPAAAWRDHDRRHPVPEWRPPAGLRRLVVVAPHPDDEILGLGVLTARCAAAGVRVTILGVTDGQASHPHSPTLDPDRLARLRVAESVAACAVLGLPAPVRLGVPDGDVAGHVDRLSARIALSCGPGTAVAVTWRGDGHPDHEAAGAAAARAAARTGARLLEYPVWTWHWASPGDPRVPWDRRRVLHLTEAELAAKRAAVDRFTTQIHPLSPAPGDEPILPPWILERLVHGNESVFV